VTFQFEDTRPQIGDQEVLMDLRRVASELGRSTLTQTLYRERGRFSTTLVKKRFKSWNRALTLSGLGVDSGRRDIPDEELFDNLRRAWISLGRQPRQREMAPPFSEFGRSAYVRRFGSWLAAMRAFVASQGDANEMPPRESATAPKSRDPSLRMRFVVMQRDQFKCVACGRSPATHAGIALHLDHIIPFSKGGPTNFENLRTLCASCNLGKGDLL
jgi:hypothetical protein